MFAVCLGDRVIDEKFGWQGSEEGIGEGHENGANKNRIAIDNVEDHQVDRQFSNQKFATTMTPCLDPSCCLGTSNFAFNKLTFSTN